jgi:glycosyltransferase involved in cell wall biosynthesis
MKAIASRGVASAKSYRPYVRDVREQAIASFRAGNGERSFAPVVVVIAAYNEEDAIGGVLEAIAPEACGLDVEVLVVDDGSVDETAAIAEAHGVNLVRLERNCGHGIALRVGYQLAREHGAEYIVTLDADGQWDPVEIPRVLEPVVEGEADFVVGSRVLGRAETDDAFRHAGVRFFAALIRLLTRVPVTDTSSGFRAMQAEVTGKVRQEQVQYQSSELLIGAIYEGYRVAERPVVMHKRTAGKSKKGHNLLYGLRYARVTIGTWWRERRAARRALRAARDAAP